MKKYLVMFNGGYTESNIHIPPFAIELWAFHESEAQQVASIMLGSSYLLYNFTIRELNVPYPST